MIRHLLSYILCITLIFSCSLQSFAQEENGKKEPNYFFNSFLDWAVLSYATYTGELDAAAGSVFSKLVDRYKDHPQLGPFLENINESSIQGGLDYVSKDFFRQTGIRLYFVGEFDDVGEVGYLRHFNVLFQEKLEEKTTPYIVITVHLSGNNEVGYSTTVSAVASPEINLKRYKLDKSEESNPFYSVVKQNISGRNTFSSTVRQGLINGTISLREQVDDNFLPPLLISARDEWYKTGESIEIGGGASGTVSLFAITNEGGVPEDSVMWTIDPDSLLLTSPFIEDNRLDFPLEAGGEFQVTATSGENNVSVTLNVLDVELSIDYILRQLLVEVLTPLFEAEKDRLEQLALDSLNTLAEAMERSRELEALNYPIAEGDNTLTPLLDEPRVLNGEDTVFFNRDPLRQQTMQKIRGHKKLQFDLAKGRKLVSFVRGAIQNRDSLEIIFNDMMDNIGTVIGDLTAALISGNAREQAKEIIVDYLEENLSRLAGQEVSLAEIQPLSIVPTNQVPDGFDPTQNYYINPKIPYTEAQLTTLRQEIEAFLTANPGGFVVVNYSQDINRESFLARAPKGVPLGLEEGLPYKVINVVNYPGSILEDRIETNQGVAPEDRVEVPDNEILITSFLHDFMCAIKEGGSTEVWNWPFDNRIVFPGIVTLFDGNDYRIWKVERRRDASISTTFSQMPIVEQSGASTILRFYADDNKDIAVTIDTNQKEDFLKLLRGTEFDSNFDTWLKAIKEESNRQKREDLIITSPTCALENYGALSDRLDLIELVLENKDKFFDQYEEKVLTKLINDVVTDDIVDFHQALIDRKYKSEGSLFKKLIDEFNDTEWVFTDGNSAALIGVLTSQALASGIKPENLNRIKSDLEDDNLLFLWSGVATNTGSNQYNLYSSRINTQGVLNITVGEWYSNDWSQNKENTYPYNPLSDWIVLYPTVDIPQIGYQAGQTYVVPAIVLHYLTNEAANEDIKDVVYTSLDIASFAVGVGAITSGIRGWKLAVAVMETVSAATSISLTVFEDDLKKAGWSDEEINDIRTVTALLELAGMGVLEGPKLLSRINNLGSSTLAKLDNLGSYAANLKPAVRQRLEQIRELVRKLVGSASSSFRTVTKAIVKQELTTEFINALKKFGKSEDEILEYFTNYHNDNKFRFLNEIQNLMSQYPSLAKTEAYTIWGYTTNFFYWDLNNWLRNGVNLTQLSDIKNILKNAINKLPKYDGVAYRAIKLDGEALSKFLSDHSVGNTVRYDDFVSCGSTQKAAFFDRPDKNVRLIMEVNSAPDISDFADGIKFRGYERKELLVSSGSKFIVENYEVIDDIHYINIKQIP